MHGDAVPDHPQWKFVMERYLTLSVLGHEIPRQSPPPPWNSKYKVNFATSLLHTLPSEFYPRWKSTE